MLRIGVDAMGGDFAPGAVVRGAVSALDALSAQSRIVLFGDRAQIEAVLAEEGCPPEKFDIVATTEVVGMDDHPAVAFSKKTDSSITVGFTHLKEGLVDVFASAGNTGAMMVGSMMVIKQLEGVIRPTISAVVPTMNGGYVVILDVGLNVDCKPDVLCQYGLIGSIFAQTALGIERPRVALLNIGEEKEKGNLASKAAYEMMNDNGQYDFVGNIESKYIFTGEIADVVVCDGFVGNIILKQAEGFYEICRQQGVMPPYVENLNYENVGGTPVLGIKSNVIIGHGCSSPLAIKNMILQGERTVKGGFVKKLRDILA